MTRKWYVAPSLNRLLAEVNNRWPNRDKKSDGAIGDAAHSARDSDHNPNSRGSVNARDFDADGIDPMVLVNAAIRDRRTNYVIFNRQIWSRSRGFVPRTYSGSNPHTGHVHVSILQDAKAENETHTWGIGEKKMSDEKLNKIIALLEDKDNGLPQLKAQLYYIAKHSFGRAALNKRNAEIAEIIQKAVTAGIRNVPGVPSDIDRLVERAVLSALESITFTYKGES